MKLTKQGVRDLNNIGNNKSKGIKLENPPVNQFCKHVRIKDHLSGDSHCIDCGLTWDWQGIPYTD